MDTDNLYFYQWDPCRGPLVEGWTKLMTLFVWKEIQAFLCQSTKSWGKWGNRTKHKVWHIPLCASVLLVWPPPAICLDFPRLVSPWYFFLRLRGTDQGCTSGSFNILSISASPVLFSQLQLRAPSCVAHWNPAHLQAPILSFLLLASIRGVLHKGRCRTLGSGLWGWLRAMAESRSHLTFELRSHLEPSNLLLAPRSWMIGLSTCCRQPLAHSS